MKTLVVGVPGFNRGDDAILLGLMRLLDISPSSHSDLSLRFFALRRLDSPSFKNFKQIIWSRRSISFHFQAAHSVLWADIVLLGGGSIVQDKFGAGFLRGITGAFCEVVFFASLFRCRVITLPIGVDKLSTSQGRRVGKYLLRKVSSIAVRDKESLLVAGELLGDELSHKSPKVLCDPALALYDVHFGESNQHNLVLCPAFEGSGEAEMKMFFAELAELHLNSSSEASVTFIAMDERDAEDGGFLKRMQSMLPPSESISYLIPSDAVEAITSIRSAGMVASMRLHPLILSLGHTASFCLSRGPKMKSLASRYDIPMLSIDSDLPSASDCYSMLADARAKFTPMKKDQMRKLIASEVSALRSHLNNSVFGR